MSMDYYPRADLGHYCLFRRLQIQILDSNANPWGGVLSSNPYTLTFFDGSRVEISLRSTVSLIGFQKKDQVHLNGCTCSLPYTSFTVILFVPTSIQFSATL